MKPLLTGATLTGLAALSFTAVVTMFGPQGEPTKSLTARPDKDPVSSEAVLSADTSSKSPSVQVSDNQAPDNQAIEAAIAGITAPASRSDTPSDDPIAAALPFGTDIGGDFDLIDHFGESRQLEDYRGKHVMIFFGYANCLAICSTALPLMADTVTQLGDKAGSQVVPLMITVDPENDTPEFMKKRLGEYHPSLIGMTGSDGALADVRNKFKVRVEHVGDDIEGNPIYNHGSFVYLMGPDGKFQTLMPPILDSTQMANIVKKYINKSNQAS